MSGAAAGVVTTSTGPCRAASAWTSGVVRTTSPRKAVWMTRARPGAAGAAGLGPCNLEGPTRPAPQNQPPPPGAVLQALQRQGGGLFLEHAPDVDERRAQELDPTATKQTVAHFGGPELHIPADKALGAEPAV